MYNLDSDVINCAIILLKKKKEKKNSITMSDTRNKINIVSTDETKKIISKKLLYFTHNFT